MVRVRNFALAGLAAVLVGATAGPQPAFAQNPNGACQQALSYEKSAAADSATAQARYDATNAGLTANQRCNDGQMHLLNEAYLLSMRAPAEHDLRLGDWQRDMMRANMLLTQCAGWPGLKGTSAGANCATQLRYNGIIEKNIRAQPTPAPSRAPTATSSPATNGSPAPGTSAAPAPRLGPAMPPPAPPQPAGTPAPAASARPAR